jgi:WD40 repeat protein
LRRQLRLERIARKVLSYQADMRRAAQLAEAEEWPGLHTLLDQYRPADGETDVRSWEWHFLDSVLRKNQLVDRQAFVLQGPTEGVHQLTWSGNGARLAAAGEDGSVVVWDLKTGTELRRLGGKTRLVCLDHEGRLITLSAENGTVALFGTEKGHARRFFGPIQGLFNYRQPAFSPDGSRLALAVGQTVAAVFDTANGRELHRLAGHQSFVSAVAWDPKGQVLATGSRDGTIRLWDAASGSAKATFDADDEIEGLQWNADGRQIAAATSRGTGTGQVRIWDIPRHEKVFTVEAQYGTTWRPNQPRAGLFFSADGKRVAAEAIGGVTVWETTAGRPIFQGPTGSSGSQLGGCDPQVGRWAFLQMFGNRATCRVVDMESATDLFWVESDIPMNNYRSALAWSPDGKRLAAGFSQGKVYVYSVPSDRDEVRMLDAGPASFLEWSRDGRRFAYSHQGEVRIGRLPVTEPPIRLGAPSVLPSLVALSPDGSYLAGADPEGSLPIWDIASGQVALRLAGHPAPVGDVPGAAGPAPNALLWSPGAKRLASLRLCDGSLRVWDVKAGKLLTSFQFGANQFDPPLHDALPLAWSPDRQLLAARVGWQKKTVRILDVASGRQIRDWDGGPGLGSSNAMAWDSTSRKLATCLGNPPRIRIWDVTTGQEVLVLDDSVVGLHRLSWSPDGRRLAYQADTAQIHDFLTLRTTSLAGTGERLVWNPDGSRLALVGNGSFSTRFGSRTVEFYDAATGAPIPGEQHNAFPDPSALRTRSHGVEGQNYEIQSVSWSEQGMRAAATATAQPGTRIIVVWDVRTGKPELTMGQVFERSAERPQFVRMVRWAPDGRSLATLSGDSSSDAQVDLWDAATGRRTQTLAAGRINLRGATALAWSPDGRSVAFAGQQVRVWKLALSWLPLTLQQPSKGGPEADQTFLGFSPDSRSLAVLECRHSSGHEQVIKAWDLTTAKERFRWTLPYQASDLHAPIAWSPDGKRLAWGGPKPAVWNVASGKVDYPLAGHSAPVRDVEWSPDGGRVLSRSEVIGPFTRSFELKVWDNATAHEVLMLRGPMAGWSPAPGFQALASAPGVGSDPAHVIVWDLAPRTEK